MIRKLDLKKVLEPLSTVRRVLPILWASARGWSIVAAVLMVLEIAFGLLTLYLVKNLVDVITSQLSAEGQAAAIETVLWHVLAFGGATLAFLITRGLANLAREAQGMLVADHVDRMIHSSAVSADLAFYESPQYFDTLQRARQSGPQRPAQVTSNLLLLGKNLIMLGAVIALLASINWMLLPILAVAIIPALFVRIHFTRRLYDWQRQRTQMERRAGYLDWLMTSDIHAKELRLNQLGDYLRDCYARIRSKIRDEKLKISKRRTLVELVVGVVASAVFFFALAYLAMQTAAGSNTVGDLVLFLLIFQRAQSMGQEIVSQISRFYEDHLYIGLLFEFLEVKPKVISPGDPKPIPDELTKGIEFINVTFTYPGSGEEVLRDINLSIPRGKVIALVGANGSGKTSLIKLLTRLYDPNKGCVSLDGSNIKQYDLLEYRSLFGVVFQDYTKYANTIAENIGFGDIQKFSDKRAIERAAQASGADRFIQAYTQKYDTLLGRLFDGGRDLSEGEWQKIALARSLMNRARIIVLDEPTSSMDPDSEYALFSDFKKRIGNRTALLISHRLSTVKNADYIYVFESGRISEQGTHDELFSSKGPYHQSFTRQGAGYI